ncbi:MAG: phosphate ABC transporter substrate-binding protein PstS, partial [Propionibacteriaceae bacterium]|nr:phosphate ABC transporter substrate-binding protein PstS [Propionibacteriaceae bacterium]
MKLSVITGFTVATVLCLAACAVNEAGAGTPVSAATTGVALTGTLNAGGSSAQTAAQEAWRAGFQDHHPGVTVNYDPTGSGTGRTNFTDGGYTLAGTDAAFSRDAAGGAFAPCAAGSALVEIPAYISGIAIGFTLDGITSLNLDAATVARIFAGAITTWDDPAIANQNPGVALPGTPVTAVHRSDKSGTTENFTAWLAAAAPAAWPYPAAQTWPDTLAGEAAEKTQGVRETVRGTTGAIAYLDASQATGLGIVAVKVGPAYVAPSAAGAAAAVGQSPLQPGRAATDVVIDLNRTL